MRKLLIVTGAGASLGFGIPSVKDIDLLFEKWSLEILPLKHEPSKSLYSWVKEKLFLYVSQDKSNRLDNIINFENILFLIQNLYSLSKDKKNGRFNNSLNSFIDVNEFPEVVSFKKEKKADCYDFHFLHSRLIDKLLYYFRTKCKTIEADNHIEIESLKLFFEYLKEDFEIGFITLNYDNILTTALPNLNTGFDKISGEFNRDQFYKPGWNFCYHLHGSIHFDMKGGKDNTEMHKILWNDDLSSQFSSNSSGRSGNYTSEGLDHLNSSIIAGLDKVNQILKEPFGSYYMSLDKLLYESDSILFIGYGFNDLHLNKIFPFIRYDNLKTRKVVIIDWANDNEDGLNFRHDSWSFGVFTTLPFNGFEMGDGKSRLPHPAIHFKKANKLEKSSNPKYPIAIWYNGILEACKHAHKIKKELL